MTLVERTSNPIFGSLRPKKFLIRQVACDDAGTPAAPASDPTLPSDEAPDQAPDGVGPPSYGDPTRASHLTGVIAAADAEAARIIGIVGARRGVGSSVTSRQLAGAFAGFDRKTLLVDTSRAAFSRATAATSLPALEEIAIEIRPALLAADVAAATGEAPLAPAAFVQALKAATETSETTVIVDLPPIALDTGLPNPLLRELGGACDLVFLVCLAGTMTRKELSDCIETCKVVGLDLDGLILNDWKLPAGRLLER